MMVRSYGLTFKWSVLVSSRLTYAFLLFFPVCVVLWGQWFFFVCLVLSIPSIRGDDAQS